MKTEQEIREALRIIGMVLEDGALLPGQKGAGRYAGDALNWAVGDDTTPGTGAHAFAEFIRSSRGRLAELDRLTAPLSPELLLREKRRQTRTKQ
jgi:hypothetical protein